MNTLAVLLLTPLLAAAFQAIPDPATPMSGAEFAVATNQPSAEQQLKAIIRSSPRSQDANQAHLLLARVYARAARYKSLTDNLDRWRKSFPDSPDLREHQKDAEQFRGLPDQTNSTPRPVQLHHDGDLWFPVSINGKVGKYLFDTGADVSILTESEARRLGLKLRAGSVHIGDSSGLGFNAHTAVAREVMVGTTRFKNVSFVVMPDPDSTEGPPHGGIIGLPVIRAMLSIHWNKSGTADFATPGDAPAKRNMTFFKNKPLVEAVIEGQPVFFTLDSGAETTDLNRRFADRFSSLLANAKRDEASIIGAGGTAKFEARKLDSLPFILGTRPVNLSPAVVTMQSNPGLGGDCCIGNLGEDILFSGSGFRLDFSRMTLRLF